MGQVGRGRPGGSPRTAPRGGLRVSGQNPRDAEPVVRALTEADQTELRRLFRDTLVMGRPLRQAGIGDLVSLVALQTQYGSGDRTDSLTLK